MRMASTLLCAIVLSVPAAMAAEEDAALPRLEWRAQHEEALYGYLVYRSEARSGPFLRVSKKIVRVPEDGSTSHSYEFVDATAEPCRTYYYYLDQVLRNGAKSRFSGVLAKETACPAEGEASTSDAAGRRAADGTSEDS